MYIRSSGDYVPESSILFYLRSSQRQLERDLTVIEAESEKGGEEVAMVSETLS